jgi:hypothetical protein
MINICCSWIVFWPVLSVSDEFDVVSQENKASKFKRTIGTCSRNQGLILYMYLISIYFFSIGIGMRQIHISFILIFRFRNISIRHLIPSLINSEVRVCPLSDLYFLKDFEIDYCSLFITFHASFYNIPRSGIFIWVLSSFILGER